MNEYCKIESLSLTNTFFESLQLDFSESLNCIMGARGTGKTTLLEFIRYALGIPLTVLPDKNKEIQTLLESNLKDGVIEVRVRREDGRLYRVERTLGILPQVYNESGNRVDVDPAMFFAIDIFGQGEIEALAVKPEEQLSTLIDGFRKQTIDTIKQQIESLRESLDDNAKKQIRLLAEIRKIKNMITQSGDVEDQFKKIQKELGAIKSKELDEIKIERAKHRDFEAEGEVLTNCKDWFGELQIRLYNLSENLDGWENVLEFPQDYSHTNWSVLNNLSESISHKIRKAKEVIGQLHAILNEISEAVLLANNSINPLRTQQASRFQTLLSKYKTFQSQTQRLLELQKKLDELKKLRLMVARQEEELKSLMDQRRKLKEKVPPLVEERFRKRYDIASELTSLLGNDIKVDIERNALRNEYYSTLLEILYGSGMKYTALVEKIVNYYAPDEFSAVVRRKDRASLSSCFGFDDNRIDNLINHLLSDGGENLFLIEQLILDDKPEISLRIRERGTYKDQFRAAHLLSTGQRCTTILPILLVRGSGPLIIDQPELSIENMANTNHRGD